MDSGHTDWVRDCKNRRKEQRATDHPLSDHSHEVVSRPLAVHPTYLVCFFLFSTCSSGFRIFSFDVGRYRRSRDCDLFNTTVCNGISLLTAAEVEYAYYKIFKARVETKSHWL